MGRISLSVPRRRPAKPRKAPRCRRQRLGFRRHQGLEGTHRARASAGGGWAAVWGGEVITLPDEEPSHLVGALRQDKLLILRQKTRQFIAQEKRGPEGHCCHHRSCQKVAMLTFGHNRTAAAAAPS